MNRIELEKKLVEVGVNPLNYSLDGNFKLDAIILYYKYSKWIVNYIDDRGGIDEIGTYCTEIEACNSILECFKLSIELEKTRKKNN